MLPLASPEDTTTIEAAYADGMLTLTIAVAERARPRRIPVSANSGTRVIEGVAAGGGDQ